MEISGWEKMYSAGERGDEDLPTALLVEIARRLKPGSAIDLACGAGRNAIYLAELGWTVAAVDGSTSAIEMVQQRSQARDIRIHTAVADLTAPAFHLEPNAFDLIVIAYYLQRDLFPKAKLAARPGGVVLAIAHIPDPGDKWTAKRAKPGELHEIFADWEILHDYEGPSRDPAHRRPVAEIVARRPELTGELW
jgi:SAM-dependent methyltransferase